MTTTATFPARINAARNTVAEAGNALALALRQVEPMSPELHQMFVTHKPLEYAECLRKVADILATIPALREALEQAEQALAPLEDAACWKCHGTGQYAGATNARRRGVPYCFDCDGHGTRAR
jgi:hypothetical protein